MPGLVKENDKLVTYDGEPVTYEFQQFVENSGPTPPDRTYETKTEGREMDA